ncbi:MAG TPA: hypothetical protein VF682_13255 [Pseudomonas sp.]
MLLNNKQLRGFDAIKRLPSSSAQFPLLLAEAEQKISGQSPKKCLLLNLSANGIPDFVAISLQLFVEFFCPFPGVVKVTHMSGLRGLFVWKQKATTEALDTYSA